MPNKVDSSGKSQPLIGNDCHLYADPMATWVPGSTGPATEITEAMDVSLADWSVGEVEIVTRASDWAVNLAGKMRAALEFQYLYGAEWAIIDMLIAAFQARTILAWWVSDLPTGTINAQGLYFPGLIVQAPINQGVEDAVTMDTIRVVPAYAIDTGDQRLEPYWLVDAGAGVFSAEDAVKALSFNEMQADLYNRNKLGIIYGPRDKRQSAFGGELEDAARAAGKADKRGLKKDK